MNDKSRKWEKGKWLSRVIDDAPNRANVSGNVGAPVIETDRSELHCSVGR